MPVDFLTEEQVAAYGAFARTPTRAELERFCFLDDEDRRMVERRRGRHNRLGFGVQLGTVRMLGRFLDPPTDVPREVVDYVAQQLGTDDPSCLAAYGSRPQTVLEHAWEIRRTYGYREFNDVQLELSAWLDARAWTTGDGPKALFDASVEWLLERKALLPGVTTLARCVSRMRDQANSRLWEQLFALLNDQQKRRLERLLTVPEGARVSNLERLRHEPKRESGPQMTAALKRVAELAELGFVGFDTSTVPPRRLIDLARYGMVGRAGVLQRHPPPRRHATLLATAISLHARSIDDALDLFDGLMATNLVARAERQSKDKRLRSYPKLAAASSTLAAAVKVLIAAATGATDIPLARVLTEIEAIASSDELAAAVSTVVDLTPAEDSDMDEAWRAELTRRFRTVRPFLGMLAEVIEFGATPVGSPVLEAMRSLAGLLGRKRVSQDEIDTGLLAGSWRRLVLNAPHLDEGTIDRRAYVFCVLEKFWRHLQRREIYANHSNRWSDPRAKLLTGHVWDQIRPTALASLNLPEDPAEHLAERARLLDETYRQIVEGLEENEAASVDTDGRLHLGSLAAMPEPASLLELRDLTESMLPQVDLPDVLLEVAAWTGYPEAFTPASGGGSRVEDLEISIAALLVAHACNIGLTPVAKDDVTALSRDRLSHLDQNYLCLEGFKRANRTLIETQSGIPLAQLWGGGLVASIDGMRFIVPVASIHARPNPRYFGRRAGVTWLNMVNDQAAGLAGKIVAGTPRDSLHVLDVLYDQDGGVIPDLIITDTGSYSDTVFGLLTLGGRRYAPQLADIPDQKLWRVDRNADYGVLNKAARGRIDLDKICRHWPDILRVVVSIHTGTVRAHDVMRMLHRGGRPTPLGDAIAEYGRIHKSLHVLQLADDENYRRQIKIQTNIQEGRHSLARRIFHGQRGMLYQRYHEGMEDQIGALGLVLNAIVLWNTRYLDAAVNQLRANGYPVSEDDAARLNPFIHRHINMGGRYAFVAPRLGGVLRSFRKPDTDADEKQDAA